MKKGILLISFMVIAITTSLAQKNQDFIISLTQDTIFGKVYLSDASNVTFKYHKKKLHFHPASIGNFGIYEDGIYQIYKPIKNAKGAFAIVKVVHNGKLKLYEYQRRHQAFGKESFYMIGYTDQKLVTLSPTTFDKTISGFLQDAPNLLVQLATANYHHIPELIAAYNQLQTIDKLASLSQNTTTR